MTATTIKIAVYHNLNIDCGFGLNQTIGDGGRRPAEPHERHELVKVFEYEDSAPREPAEVMALLERAFYEFNVGEDDLAAAYRARRLRSLSVGDVLILASESEGEGAWSCQMAGWAPVPTGELRVVAAAEADKILRERFQYAPEDALSISVPWEA